MKYLFTLTLVCTLLGALPLRIPAQSERDKAVRLDKQEVSEDDTWIYDNFKYAREEAVRSKKPLLIVFAESRDMPAKVLTGRLSVAKVVWESCWTNLSA
jgi:hypothetical protein